MGREVDEKGTERRASNESDAKRARREFEEVARQRGRREAYEWKQTGHEARHREMSEKAAAGRLEWNDRGRTHVRVDDILEPERAGERPKVEDPNFWYAHGNTPEFYDSMGEKYPRLRERLARGETLDDLKSDEEMRVAAEFWYGERPVELEKYGDSHFINGGYHRYMLGRKFELGEIPAHVKEARERR